MKHVLPNLLFNQKEIPKIEKQKNAKFLGEFASSEHSTQVCALFWQDEPPVEGYSHFFALFYHPLYDSIYITCGQKIADRTRNGVITPNGDFIYSRHRHDYVEHDGCVIDGGDSYLKGNMNGTHIKFKVGKNGIFQV